LGSTAIVLKDSTTGGYQ